MSRFLYAHEIAKPEDVIRGPRRDSMSSWSATKTWHCSTCCHGSKTPDAQWNRPRRSTQPCHRQTQEHRKNVRTRW